MSAVGPILEVLNFGGGVQSWTILELIRTNRLPRPNCMLFADTGWEPQDVYDGIERAKWVADGLGIEFVTVSLGDIRADHIRRAAGMAVRSGKDVPRTERSFRSMPLYTRMPDAIYIKELELHAIYMENWEREHPVGWINPETGEKEKPEPKPLQYGMMGRACTERYKIRPIDRYLEKQYGRQARKQWFGISTDEASRERMSLRRWVTFHYPLLYAIPMSRKECLDLLAAAGITAPKSACIACPYHSRGQWMEMRKDPAAWASACEFDRIIRHMPGGKAECFVHPSRLPLEEVDFDNVANGVQMELFGAMENECVGMCGL